MDNGHVFERNVLLRMRRRYSESEAVAFMSKMISELEFKIGEQNSEICELRHKLHQKGLDIIELNKKIKECKPPVQNQSPIPDHIKKDEYVALLKAQHKKQMEGHSDLKKRFAVLQNNYFSLLVKCNKQIELK